MCGLIFPVFFAVFGLAAFANGADDARVLPNRQDGTFVVRDFKFESGQVLPELKLGYTTIGTAQSCSCTAQPVPEQAGLRLLLPRRFFGKGSLWMPADIISSLQTA
jgi:homoserine O-acetyltransferase